MASYSKVRWDRIAGISFALVAMLCGVGTLASAQEQSAPKVELFGGYSYFNPGADFHGLIPGALDPISGCLCSTPRGAGVSATYEFNRWLGLTGDMSGHWGTHQTTLANKLGQSSFYNLSVGPQVTFRGRHFSPFIEALVGVNRLTPEPFHPDDQVGFIGGGGLALNLSRHVAWRLVQADYVYSNHHFGPGGIVPATDIRGLRLQAGIVFMFGGGSAIASSPRHVAPPAPVEAQPTPEAIVKPLQPPTVTCYASPSTVNPGDTSTITANGVSPQNLPLTYSYNATAGSIIGTGTTAMLSTAGAASGMITVTCNVIDSANQSAAQTVSVMVAAPVATAKPNTSDLCTISFARDGRRPARIDNEAKACLDEIALNLQHDSYASLVIVGNTAAGESNRKLLASQRAANAKAYLVTEKGIDSSRITLYTGSHEGKDASNTLVPAGATFDPSGDTPVRGGADKTHSRSHRRNSTRATSPSN
jgi:hypothetical protein